MSLKTPSINYNLPVEYDKLKVWEKALVRSQYIRKQQGKCAYCGEHLEDEPAQHVKVAWINKKQFPEGMFNHPIHLDHDHFTGLTRGAVHAKCNAYMWQYMGM